MVDPRVDEMAEINKKFWEGRMPGQQMDRVVRLVDAQARARKILDEVSTSSDRTLGSAFEAQFIADCEEQRSRDGELSRADIERIYNFHLRRQREQAAERADQARPYFEEGRVFVAHKGYRRRAIQFICLVGLAGFLLGWLVP